MLLKLQRLFGAVTLTCASVMAESVREVDVCNLALRADQFEGKLVRVRGELRNSDRAENPFFDELVGEHCKKAQGGKITIQIVSPDSHFLANPPPGYKPDLYSVRQAEPVFKKAAADHRSVIAT